MSSSDRISAAGNGWASVKGGRWHATLSAEPNPRRSERSLCGLTFRPLNVGWHDLPDFVHPSYVCKHCSQQRLRNLTATGEDGDRLGAAEFRTALADLGLTQQQAAQLLGVHARERISDFCTGRRRVPRSVEAALKLLRQTPAAQRRRLLAAVKD